MLAATAEMHFPQIVADSKYCRKIAEKLSAQICARSSANSAGKK